jgi:hypothetical protein
MTRLRTRCIGVLAALALVAAAPVVGTAGARSGSAVVTAAKSCASGYKSATIGGKHKCLRKGQYCARSDKHEYPKYGYHCNKRDSNGRWHLS